ncbi:hypothetical protein A2714_04415 [Candidatus Woesebacteria bacterium RIFCSPHIGHO2_01_FULL_38_9]|uniref:Uncharacterized protein n=2 Tax=Candidatus Woeseibacteriota TaxID=1752722 RepID=A0A1F7Y3E4_9BACT|nr:MAG: hypothetical protein A2714_04415 [Candidatus Woesebacteria bacterium RIFCSPHIGHO2_01_FULL_38_9]OGM58199.1 MAG: hypothetical protein A3A75_03875 [Candidatus Woesebacteria bacterium RIFCSPLOWO2_01_FULL_39_10]
MLNIPKLTLIWGKLFVKILIMKNLPFIVSAYFPEEIIQKNTRVLLKTTSKLITGQEVNGFFNSGSLPIPMVETDKKYFFDIRHIYYSSKPWLPYLKNPINILISLFVLLFGGYILSGIFIGSGFGFKLFLMVFFATGIYIILNYNRTNVNILAIKKEWVTTESEENKEHILKWSLPKTEIGFSILHLLSKDKQDKLPFYLKFQSGLWASSLFPFLKKMSPVNFTENTYSYSQV